MEDEIKGQLVSSLVLLTIMCHVHDCVDMESYHVWRPRMLQSTGQGLTDWLVFLSLFVVAAVF